MDARPELTLQAALGYERLVRRFWSTLDPDAGLGLSPSNILVNFDEMQFKAKICFGV